MKAIDENDVSLLKFNGDPSLFNVFEMRFLSYCTSVDSKLNLMYAKQKSKGYYTFHDVLTGKVSGPEEGEVDNLGEEMDEMNVRQAQFDVINAELRRMLMMTLPSSYLQAQGPAFYNESPNAIWLRIKKRFVAKSGYQRHKDFKDAMKDLEGFKSEKCSFSEFYSKLAKVVDRVNALSVATFGTNAISEEYFVIKVASYVPAKDVRDIDWESKEMGTKEGLNRTFLAKYGAKHIHWKSNDVVEMPEIRRKKELSGFEPEDPRQGKKKKQEVLRGRSPDTPVRSRKKSRARYEDESPEVIKYRSRSVYDDEDDYAGGRRSRSSAPRRREEEFSPRRRDDYSPHKRSKSSARRGDDRYDDYSPKKRSRSVAPSRHDDDFSPRKRSKSKAPSDDFSDYRGGRKNKTYDDGDSGKYGPSSSSNDFSSRNNQSNSNNYSSGNNCSSGNTFSSNNYSNSNDFQTNNGYSNNNNFSNDNNEPSDPRRSSGGSWSTPATNADANESTNSWSQRTNTQVEEAPTSGWGAITTETGGWGAEFQDNSGWGTTTNTNDTQITNASAKSTSMLEPNPVEESTSMLVPNPVEESTSMLVPNPVEESTSMLVPNPAEESTSMLVPNPVEESTSMLVPNPAAESVPQEALATAKAAPSTIETPRQPIVAVTKKSNKGRSGHLTLAQALAAKRSKDSESQSPPKSQDKIASFLRNLVDKADNNQAAENLPNNFQQSEVSTNKEEITQAETKETPPASMSTNNNSASAWNNNTEKPTAPAETGGWGSAPQTTAAEDTGGWGAPPTTASGW